MKVTVMQFTKKGNFDKWILDTNDGYVYVMNHSFRPNQYTKKNILDYYKKEKFKLNLELEIDYSGDYRNDIREQYPEYFI